MDIWAVYQDGAPLKRGLTRRQAEQYAAHMANGYYKHRANEKQRIAEFEIKPDKGLIKELDENWKNRNN